MNERPFAARELAANYRKVLPHRSMAKKLSDQGLSIHLRFCKEQNPGRKTIDAMYDKRSLSLRLQFGIKK